MVSEQAIADGILSPMWQSLSKDFKSKYRMDIWGIFENQIRASAHSRNLQTFYSNAATKLQLHPTADTAASVMRGLQAYNEDEADTVMHMLRTQTAYLVLLVRQANDTRRADAALRRELDSMTESEFEEMQADMFGGAA